MRLLAQERVEVRLTFEPELVTTEGEWLSPATRGPVLAGNIYRDVYATTVCRD
jgi:hypothetical protein